MQSTYTLHEYSSSAINISLTLSQLGKKNAIAWRNNLNSAQAGKARKQRERGRGEGGRGRGEGGGKGKGKGRRIGKEERTVSHPL